MTVPSRGWRICGVDFTSRPRPRKAITVACGRLQARRFLLDSIEDLDTWAGYGAWLRRDGPWIAGFDFPFGLPRAAVAEMGWPETWPALVRNWDVF